MDHNKADPSLLQSARKTEIGEKFNRTLFAALDALEEQNIEYALIGGVASSGLGRPRSTHDIDIFVRPEDAGAALAALDSKGFKTEKTDIAWLFKGWKEDILVDIIFKSRGDIYFDAEMHRNARKIEYHGREVRTVAPEDLIIIKSAVHDEIGPHHWHDALALLSHQTINWEYLLKRARRAQRRILALLIYAQSNDIWVPNKVIVELFKNVYGESAGASVLTSIPGGRSDLGSSSADQVSRKRDPYLPARIKDALARDPRTGEQDVKILVEDKRILLRGEVATQDHKDQTEKVVREIAPNFNVDNQIKLRDLPPPDQSEEVG